MQDHRSPVVSFNFGVRPHANAAEAARYCDRLVMATVRGRELSPGEWEARGGLCPTKPVPAPMQS